MSQSTISTFQLFEMFPDEETARKYLEDIAHVVALHIAEGNTLTQLITIWAPPTENNTAAYIANVKSWASVLDENQPLWSYL